MYKRKACQHVKELESREKDQLTAFNSDLFEQVVAKCSQHHLELQSLIRYNRVEIIQSLVWKIGHVLSQEIEEKLCHSEVEYFKKHFTALKSYMSTVQLDLTVDMVLPKDPYIQVRVLDDIDQGIVLSDDKTANFSRHSMHFLKRTDAEQFISRKSLDGCYKMKKRD